MLSLFGVQSSPTQQRKRLCRLLSSVVYFSTIQEDFEYLVHQPFGSWDTFVILIVILISIGMLVLYHTARGVCVRQLRVHASGAHVGELEARDAR